MKKIELEIVGLSGSVSQSNNFAVILGEIEGDRKLPIVIGNFEAQAIAVAIERMHQPRPMTHDLFKNFMDIFHIDLQEVIINNLTDGIFFARMVCQRDGELYEIDARTSDALALAARFHCPIYTYEFIMETAGIILEEEEPQPRARKSGGRSSRRKSGGLSSYPIEGLQKMLEDMLSSEDYERAALIRDEIKRRQEEEARG
ncbi:MAG TPA: DUF151 domain-containing protein [Saprospiraceae bacterium]|nr:DUF151 domain-containing protein [Saprospiraceae bacterium]